MIEKRICVVGGGRWGRNHIRTLSELGCLSAIVESDEERLKGYREEYPKVKCYADIEKAIEARYDGYTVAVPAELHFEIGSRLLKAGLNVMMEKPMTMSVDESVELVELSKLYGGRLMVGHVLLFHSAIRKIKQLIDEGKVGELCYVYSNRLNLGTVRTEEDVFWSFAPHDISVLDYLVGSKAIDIRAKGCDYLTEGISDLAMVELEYLDNVHGHIFVSWLHPFKQQMIVVVGREGMITFDDATDKEVKYYKKRVVFENGRPTAENGEVEIIAYERTQPLTEELKYFAEHCDKDIEINRGEDGLEVVRVLKKVTELMNK